MSLIWLTPPLTLSWFGSELNQSCKTETVQCSSSQKYCFTERFLDISYGEFSASGHIMELRLLRYELLDVGWSCDDLFTRPSFRNSNIPSSEAVSDQGCLLKTRKKILLGFVLNISFYITNHMENIIRLRKGATYFCGKRSLILRYRREDSHQRIRLQLKWH